MGGRARSTKPANLCGMLIRWFAGRVGDLEKGGRLVPGTTIVGSSLSTQLYDATYCASSIGICSGAERRAGATIVSMILDVSRPSLMLASGGTLGPVVLAGKPPKPPLPLALRGL